MPSEIYSRLRQHLDQMPVALPATESGVELRILERLFTPEEAEIALEVSAVPEPAATIHKRLAGKMTAAELQSALDGMAAKGIIRCLPSPEGPTYSKMLLVVGMYEAQIERLTPELERDMRQYFREGFGKALYTGKTTQQRVVPVNRKIPVEREVATHDDIRAYVETAPGPFAKMPCVCRKGKELLGEPCKHAGLGPSCLTFGVAAEAMAARGHAVLITREEMITLLDNADKEGLVLQPQNTISPLFVCCCCGCCCGLLTTARRFDRPADYFHASYYAEIDETQCQSCGVCATRCKMDAIQDGSGPARVERSRCIGCALCATTCPSGAVRMKPAENAGTPAADTHALYLKIMEERLGRMGMLKVAARKSMGMKI